MPRRLLVLLSTLCLVSACSSAGADDPAAPATTAARRAEIGGALERSGDAPTGRFRYVTVVESGPADDLEAFTTTITGAFDRPAERYSVGVSVPDGVAAVEVLRTVLDGDRLYLWGALPMPSGWVGTTHPDGPAALLEEVEANGLVTDPTVYAEVLLDAEAMVPDGSDTIDGEVVDRYRTSVPVGSVLDQIQGPEDPEVGSLRSMLEEHGDDVEEAVPTIVWLHPDGSLRRFELQTRPYADAEGSVVLRLTLDLYDYGQEITIEVPDPAEVRPVP
jgi:hypothetical protein